MWANIMFSQQQAMLTIQNLMKTAVEESITCPNQNLPLPHFPSRKFLKHKGVLSYQYTTKVKNV